MDRGVGAAVRPLPESDRRDLAIQALARSETVSNLAAQHGVSRKFVYQQTHKARAALDDAFSPATPDEAVLFELAVTKIWLRQVSVGLTLIGALLAPTPPESHGAQSGATAPRDSAAGAQPRAGPPASAGGTSMASTHPLPRSSTVAHALSAVGVDGLRTMRLHRVLDQLLTITMHRPYWSPTWRGARSDRALRSVPTYVGKLRSVALLCPAYVAALAAGHHGCALACQAPI